MKASAILRAVYYLDLEIPFVTLGLIDFETPTLTIMTHI